MCGIPFPERAWGDVCESGMVFKFTDIPHAFLPRFSSYLEEKSVFTAENRKRDQPVIISVVSPYVVSEEKEDKNDPLFSDFITRMKGILHNIHRSAWEFKLSGQSWKIDSPRIMGILNVTPDSFSDGGRFFSPDMAVQHALEMQEAGADLIDIGAESSRPGAEPVGQEEEWRRLAPVLKALSPILKVPISVDTYKAEIARRSLDEGADIVNDISALTMDPKMAETVARAGCPVILMHMRGTPRSMQRKPSYRNLMEEIHLFFKKRIEFCRREGIQQLIIDPGLGFGKRYADNYEIMRRLREFRIFGHPLLIGPSRKSFIAKASDTGDGDRLMGTAAAVIMSLSHGASICRVHNVREIRQAVRIFEEISRQKIF